MNWLHYQLALMPSPGAILHIGAGLCSELPDYQQIEPDRIILVEPNPETINALRQKAADYDNVTLLQAAVAAEAGRARLRRFNFPELDSLREPAGLYQLLPGLQEIGRTEVSTISPAQLTRRLSLADSTNNWLVLEAPGEETVILEELNRTGALQNFSRLIVRTGAEPIYEGDAGATPLLERLEAFGYFVEATPDENDPDWPRFHLKFQPLALKYRDLEARVEEEGARNEQLESERSALAAELEQTRAEWDKERQALEEKKTEEVGALNSRIAELEKERDDLESARQKLSEQAEASAQALEQAKAEWEKERQALEEKKTHEVNGLNSRIKDLEKQREELESTRHEFSKRAEANAHALEQAKVEWDQERQALRIKAEERERRLAELTEKALDELDSNSNILAKFSETSSEHLQALETRLLNQVLPKIDNSAKQIEAYIGIQSFLQIGEAPPELHNWAISPDLALYLMRLISESNYDLIIEFGSGSSTVLMAQAVAELMPRYFEGASRKTMAKMLEKRYQKTEDNGRAQSIETTLSAKRPELQSEITPRILAFEHMREHYEKTSKMLTDVGYRSIVKLLHAPLKDLHLPGNDHFLYYDCQETLDAVSRSLSGEPKKILTLVDGPPGRTGKNARFPAMQILLAYFAHHHIDVIADDTKRADEKEIIDKWSAILETHGRQFSKITLPFEKGATLIKIR